MPDNRRDKPAERHARINGEAVGQPVVRKQAEENRQGMLEEGD
jgi:hypothetical protein